MMSYSRVAFTQLRRAARPKNPGFRCAASRLRLLDSRAWCGSTEIRRNALRLLRRGLGRLVRCYLAHAASTAFAMSEKMVPLSGWHPSEKPAPLMLRIVSLLRVSTRSALMWSNLNPPPKHLFAKSYGAKPSTTRTYRASDSLNCSSLLSAVFSVTRVRELHRSTLKPFAFRRF